MSSWPEALAAALASAPLGAVASAWIRSRTVEAKARAQAEARIAEAETRAEVAERDAKAKVIDDLRAILREEREIVAAARAGEQVAHAGHLECLERVSQVEASLASMRRERDDCTTRTTRLEQDLANLRGEMLRLYATGGE
jgi:acyl-coenzyme A synthetase/AMP-(fatty) acid ligase